MELTLASHRGGGGGWPSKAEAVGQWYISVCEALVPLPALRKQD